MARREHSEKVQRLHNLIADYTLGFVDQLNKLHGGKGGSRGTHAIFTEGEKDATESGRQGLLMTDLNSVPARVVFRLREVQKSESFGNLTPSAKLQALQNEGQRLIDEVIDDGEFQPYPLSDEERAAAQEKFEALHAANPRPVMRPRPVPSNNGGGQSA